MSDASVLLLFLLVPILIAARWIFVDRAPAPLFWGAVGLALLVSFLVWMVTELREGAPVP